MSRCIRCRYIFAEELLVRSIGSTQEYRVWDRRLRPGSWRPKHGDTNKLPEFSDEEPKKNTLWDSNVNICLLVNQSRYLDCLTTDRIYKESSLVVTDVWT